MLRFLSLTVEDFGPYKNRQTIDFTSDDGVTIIWGNNGRGKTTLLNAFRYALFGKVYGRNTKIQHSLQKISNWESFDEGKYGFKVILKMDSDGVVYELTRQYTVRSGVSIPLSDNDYKEDVFLKRDTTIVSPEERDHILKSIMPEQVSRFFLFDGELLGEYEELLHDENSIGHKIKESIERILGVPVLINGFTDTKAALKEYQNRLSKAAQKDQNTQIIGSLLEAKQAELKSHEDDCISLKKRLEELQNEKQKIEDEMKRTERTRELLNQQKRLKEAIEKKEEAKKAKLQEMKSLTKKAWQGMLGTRINDLMIQLDGEIAELETKKTKYVISQQIVDELKKGINTGRCPVCDQTLDISLINRLNDKINNPSTAFGSLTAEEENKLIELQGRKAQLKKLNASDLKAQIKSIEDSIADLTVEISDAEQELDAIVKQLSGVEDTARASSVTNDFAKCIQKISVVEEGIKKEEEIITKTINEIRGLEEKLKKQAGSGELAKAEKRKEFCEKIKDIFEKGVDLYRDSLKQKVERDASNIFVNISNEPDYSGLKINENYGLYIAHKSGRIIEIRSSGYEHIVALSLIGALHKNAPLQGPVIMDSPFGRLDPEHKRKITASLPILSEQVILLVYIDEIDEQLARKILGSTLKHEYELCRISAMHTEIKKMIGSDN